MAVFKRKIVGKVLSNKMNKTVVIEVVRKVQNKTFKKFHLKRRKFQAHDENNQCGIGDVVEIKECRPMSKNKCFVVTKIIEKALVA